MYENKKKPGRIISHLPSWNGIKNQSCSFEFRENDVVILVRIARQWFEVKTEGLVVIKNIW
jgi:hypothetical protein